MGAASPVRKILILMADEFRHDAGGFAGRGLADTPHLDSLAQGGAIFENAYTPSPVCVPARQCMATGLYPSRAGCVRFGDDIEPGSRTFARWFADHGFYTVCCGKLHHRGPDQMQGWLHRIGAEQAVRWPTDFADRPQIGRQKWRGLEELLTAGPGVSVLGLQDDLATRGACDFLRGHFGGLTMTPQDVPLMLMVSLQQPHFPLRCDPTLFDKYLDRVPVFDDEPPLGHPLVDFGRLSAAEGVRQEDCRRATAAYAALVEQADSRFGCVLNTLAELGENIDDWLVIFCADHGDMLGQHGRWEKRSFYEGSVRIPLFVRGPGIDPHRISRAVNLIDLFPTLCRQAGLTVPDGLDGHDLFDATAPDLTFSEYAGDQLMVRTGRWKYLHFPAGGDVLFDLGTDPGETRNRIDDQEFQDTRESLRSFVSRHRSPKEVSH
ncbi:MAG: choline-sulfatase [Terrimicrobiaceae bacterium]